MSAGERGESANPISTEKLVEHALFAIFTGTPPDPGIPGLDRFVRRIEYDGEEESLQRGGDLKPSASDLEFISLDKLGSQIGVKETKAQVLTRALQRAKGYWVSQRKGTPGREEGLRTVSRRLDELNRPTARDNLSP